MLTRRRLALAAVLSGLVVLARFFPAPALVDAATGAPFTAGRLSVSWLYVALTPFSSIADAIHSFSVRQDVAFVLFLLLLYGPFRYFVLGHERERWNDPAVVVPSLCLHLGLMAVFLVWAVLGPRPAASLALDDPDMLAVDLHSHTSASWDARKSFTPEANAAWHERLGFGAAFLTDHNTTAGSTEGSTESRRLWEAGQRGMSLALEGEEVSLSGAHVVLLAPKRRADPDAYQGDEGLKRFLRDSRVQYEGLAVLSLPEYWRFHWDDLDQLIGAGAAGLELVTCSPKALAFPEDGRRRVVDLARRRGLFLTAGTDNHGWASAACAFSVMRAHAWRSLSPLDLQGALMASLRADGYAAVRVVERNRVEPAQGQWSALLDPARALWLCARAWSPVQALAALVWIWLLPGLAWLRERSSDF